MTLQHILSCILSKKFCFWLNALMKVNGCFNKILDNSNERF
jgi:hypothetical protein